jgi:hypothetical protein
MISQELKQFFETSQTSKCLSLHRLILFFKKETPNVGEWKLLLEKLKNNNTVQTLNLGCK